MWDAHGWPWAGTCKSLLVEGHRPDILIFSLIFNLCARSFYDFRLPTSILRTSMLKIRHRGTADTYRSSGLASELPTDQLI